jgi:hypothetical protein
MHAMGHHGWQIPQPVHFVSSILIRPPHGLVLDIAYCIQFFVSNNIQTRAFVLQPARRPTAVPKKPALCEYSIQFCRHRQAEINPKAETNPKGY